MSEASDRELLKQAKAPNGVPVDPWSAQVQDMVRDGLIEVRAVITPKGEQWLRAKPREGKA